jgi:5'-deoxynucleotidase YfbR-like HD superfamily hydrolase
MKIERWDDERIPEEVERLRYLFGMKKVIRYHLDRDDEVFDTESVAEHVYGMFILAEYFLPIEDPESAWDWMRIRRMMLFHDMDEIETGDKIGYLKTAEDRANEASARKRALRKIPAAMQEDVKNLMEEYEAQQTSEALFVKAIDRVEPSFHLFCEEGKRLLHRNKTTERQSRMLKDKYIEKFTALHAFNEYLTREMARRGFWTPEE